MCLVGVIPSRSRVLSAGKGVVPEDRERIVQLEKEVAEKEYLCKRIMEEMKYFKMELQHRDMPKNGTDGKKENAGKNSRSSSRAR